MDITDAVLKGGQDKMRIIQELVPGKQITLAHVIASPDPILYLLKAMIRPVMGK